jgi:hypothetical protein
MFAHSGGAKVGLTQGDGLGEPANGDPYIVDRMGVRRLEGAVYLKPQVLQLPVRLLDGKLASPTSGRMWNARLRHSLCHCDTIDMKLSLDPDVEY